MVFRFRSFRARLLVVILGLVGVSQLVTLGIVARIHNRNARAEIARQLGQASEQFRVAVEQRNALLARAAAALQFDDGLRETLESNTDRATLRSALSNFQQRIDAGVVALVALDGTVLAETRDGPPASHLFTPLHRIADASESARASGYGWIDGQLHSFTIVPFHAPDIVAWIAVGFPLDQDFVEELKRTTGVEVTLRHAGQVLATTVRAKSDFITEQQSLALIDGGEANALLQYSLTEKLAPARALETVLIVVGSGTLGVAALLGLAIARSLSRPVQTLAAHTHAIAHGDYTTRLDLQREDELGRLATAFNDMSAGLAERDRVRDLLDKHVSPEVAAQLLRDGTTLGGEEREVTILFVDLRGFSTLSEQLAPRELVALVNRYLDRMSGVLEQHGGVIDKFIGDAIMVLFGAPVAQVDAADRALAAALAMERALADLNRELADEGRAPLTLGIGINTAHVIAGNIGSHRRLNYSVMGDGVNVAARLQALTREPEYRTSIIVSAGTIAAARGNTFSARPLGAVAIKGRTETVKIFALES